MNVDRYGVRSLKSVERTGGNMRRFWNRTRMIVASCLVLSAAVFSNGPAEAEGTTLRFIPQADLRSIDPIWTTAYVTRNFGYMVFDTLFALD